MNPAIADRIRILGIDPGSENTGFALVVAKKKQPLHLRDFQVVDAGVCRANNKTSLVERIANLHEAMFQLIEEFNPQLCALEKAFVGANPQSALKLGQVRGAFICAAARCGVRISEVTPTSVKKMITGHGHADKESVAHAVKGIVGFDRGHLPADVSDAVAIALSCCTPEFFQAFNQTASPLKKAFQKP